MPSNAEFVPHKRALARLGLSRTSVWRAMRSDIADFPQPLFIRRRIYWRTEDLHHLREAMMRYRGRSFFEAATPVAPDGR